MAPLITLSSSSWTSMGASINSKRVTGSNLRSSASSQASVGPSVCPNSLTLHAPNGTRLVGFDNAHAAGASVPRFKRRSQAIDHWHRTENEPGRPYEFKDADTLLQDFFREVRRVLAEHGITDMVVSVEDRT